MLSLSRLLSISLILSVTGCATPKLDDFRTVSVGLRKEARTPIDVIDERAMAHRTTRQEPLGSVMALYLGDDKIVPEPAKLIANRLSARLGNALSGKVVILKEFEARLIDPGGSTVDNERLMTSAASAGPMGLVVAPLAGALIGAIEFGRRRITARSIIEVEIENQRFRGVAYKSFPAGLTEADVASTIEAALQDLEAQFP